MPLQSIVDAMLVATTTQSNAVVSIMGVNQISIQFIVPLKCDNFFDNFPPTAHPAFFDKFSGFIFDIIKLNY